MEKKLYIIHLGVGKVGKVLVSQIAKQKEKIKKDFKVSLEYLCGFTSKNSPKKINQVIKNAPLPFVLIDTTASDMTILYIKQALAKGGFVVLANKKILAGKQSDFDLLHQIGSKRLFYEAIIGAGLPIIRQLKDLIFAGDKIIELEGCFSGTLGFLFSEMDKGKSFSECLLEAKQKGFTEPDPRDDLSGVDVARKALILARLMGKKLEFSDVNIKGLYPKKMQKLTLKDFLKNLSQIDLFYQKKITQAKQKNKLLRYVAKVNAKECSIGLKEVDKLSDIGNLNGPENIVIFKSNSYFDNPLTVKGPGAGVEVTAQRVFADILSVVKVI